MANLLLKSQYIADIVIQRKIPETCARLRCIHPEPATVVIHAIIVIHKVLPNMDHTVRFIQTKTGLFPASRWAFWRSLSCHILFCIFFDKKEAEKLNADLSRYQEKQATTYPL